MITIHGYASLGCLETAGQLGVKVSPVRRTGALAAAPDSLEEDGPVRRTAPAPRALCTEDGRGTPIKGDVTVVLPSSWTPTPELEDGRSLSAQIEHHVSLKVCPHLVYLRSETIALELRATL